MPPEGYDFNEALKNAQWKAYDQANRFKDPINTDRVKDKTPKVVDCGELIEVNGEYVPAE